MDVPSRLKMLPLTSGVYLMKNAAGQVIYVGKAVSLRKRVASYFRKNHPDPKTRRLVEDIADIETISTASEAEALILEASLVKQYHPKYNIDLRDDKSYPYIEVTGDEFPRVAVVRPRKNIFISAPRSPSSEPGRRGAQYYGPYVEAHLIREALTLIRKIFPFCTCRPFPKKPCLDYHLGLCNAPCLTGPRRVDSSTESAGGPTGPRRVDSSTESAGGVSREEYRRNIRHIKMILEGRRDDLYRDLKKEMEALAREKKFEAAAKVRDQMRAIGALYSGSPDANYFKSAEQLQRVLSLPRLPERIEAFDISHIMGSQSVGSMVSFQNGRPDKSNYRRFRIKTISGIDDFAMIQEVVRRRYRRLKAENLPFPDLIVIDGGKGQLSAAQEVLRELEVALPVISLAKREEEIFVSQKRQPVVLPRDSQALQLLQRVRDEAHRFAVAYHRTLRGKKFLEK